MKRILTTVKAEGPITENQLAAHIGMTRPSVAHILQRLCEPNLLHAKKDGRVTRSFA